MPKMKRGIIYSLESVLSKLLKTNQLLNKRLGQLEKVLIGTIAPVAKKRRARKPKGRGKRGKRVRAKKTCKVPGCTRKHYAKGLCAAHYQKARRAKLEVKGKASK